MSDVSKKIEAVNKLEKEVNELRYYLLTIDPMKQVKRGIGNDINMVLQCVTTKKFAISASRWIGLGHHESTIEIPDSLLEKYYSIAKDHLKELEQKLEELLNGKEASNG